MPRKRRKSTKRFGVRYGSSVRKKLQLIEDRTRGPHRCPRCYNRGFLRRVNLGVWRCGKCDYTFAGGAWTPRTESGKSLARALEED